MRGPGVPQDLAGDSLFKAFSFSGTCGGTDLVVPTQGLVPLR